MTWFKTTWLKTTWRKIAAYGIAVLSINLSSAQADTAKTDLAHNFPNQMVRIVTPIGAGSAVDGLARVIADKLQDIWKQSVVVENRPGMPGTASVAKSAPDGYTLMMMSNGHVVGGLINKSLSFDPIADFQGVIKLASVPLVLVTEPKLPANTLQELITLARTKPGQMNYGSAGLGSTSFLSAELFKKITNTNFVQIPYKGGGDALIGILRGDSHIYFLALNLTVEQAKGGNLKALAIATSKRSPALPNVPTFAEAGLPEYQYDAWFGAMAPAHTPVPILNKINADISRVLQMPDVIERLQAQGFELTSSTPDEFNELMKSDEKLYRELLKDTRVGTP
ncbi:MULTISPECIES: tripartite tricarboxylate transporter substrate binding protein [unclassified Beijerinckia]|uniref:Bug family tripartite tricarboxylate transporter substrate binding protein n=1 Tax=unclassified Beijerinckia TaxID=2638183 RepID=UPI00089B1D04|nr:MULTISPECIES: tripartite tricarboxylate transporter substrate binding protein [unclassified Beijerinckia]MDH7796224.1 tripartite-type tricarboxylate transporter receptor subunit TctC [Beijerinckia sp. GAS462]SEC35820.1 Tripartite-type tricarboxylate transporter, receptor component TctC [Beijerinckia sp. 28-YEA-48]